MLRVNPFASAASASSLHLMRYNKLDLNLLAALDILLKERSVTRAADVLSMSPPAMSNALTRLREYFDDKLLVQIGRRMELTPRAQKLQPVVRDLLVRIDSTIAVSPAFEPHLSDRMFRIFASDYAQIVLGPAMMTLAARQGSTVRFEFAPQVTQPYRNLERGEADLLIVPEGYLSPEHPHEVLYPEHFVCMVWRDSALARGELTMDRYVGAEHVVMQPEGGRHEVFDGAFLNRLGVKRRIAVLTYSFIALPALLVGTERVATVHERIARRLAGAWPLEIRPTPIAFEPMPQAMQWHSLRADDPGLLWLRQLLVHAAQCIDEF